MLESATAFHVNLNCRDLERSKAFYESLGLHAAVRTAPGDVQDGAAFGLDRAEWDAWILAGRSGMASNVVDLLEWKVPAAQGAPPSNLHTQGFQRVGVVVPDLDAALRAIVEHGGRVWSEPFVHTNPVTQSDFRLVIASDPDGIAIELFEMDGLGLQFVGVVCADLEYSTAWYRALGFREVRRFPSANDDSRHLGIAGRSMFSEMLMTAPGGGISVMLVGFTVPEVVRAEPRAANAVGVWRLALLVSDVDDACRGLDGLGIECISPPVTMSMGSDLPPLRFVCFRGPDHEVIELIERPT